MCFSWADLKNIFSAPLFILPLPIISLAMQKMFKNPNTQNMIKNHMLQGLSEWIDGYYEVLKTGTECGVHMPPGPHT